jgi:hypothetical protein
VRAPPAHEPGHELSADERVEQRLDREQDRPCAHEARLGRARAELARAPREQQADEQRRGHRKQEPNALQIALVERAPALERHQIRA